MIINFNLTQTQPQGRYLFPALPAIAVLVAMGLEALPHWSGKATILTLMTAALFNVWVLFNVIVPAYSMN